MPIALTENFAKEPGKDRQWEAFLGQVSEGEEDLRAVISDLREFLLPTLPAARGEVKSPGTWLRGGPWTSK